MHLKIKHPLWLLLMLMGFSVGAQQQPVRCFTVEADQKLRQEYPQLGTLDAFEAWLAPRVKAYKQSGATRAAVITVPIIFHVIHDNDPLGSGDNLSATYINAQITQLNNDFRRILGTSGYNNSPVGADVEIEFCPAAVDPNGNTLAEPGINRINRSSKGWTAPPYGACPGGGFDDTYIENTIKPQSQWDPNQYFNVWVMDINCGILGYAQFPSQSGLSGLSTNGGPANTDGVVLLTSSIGSTTTPNPAGGVYSKGRTGTHEIGHFFGLRHIWGDGGCSVDDYCNDTPSSDAANYGCPTGHVSCSSVDMVENYMDYTDDACMNIFTQDQKARIQAVMANSPRRASLASSTVCTGGSGPVCSTTVSSFPYSESFENGLGAWTQSTADDIDWTRQSGGTPSSGTGPSAAAAGTYYMYVEASSPNYPSKQAILQSPCFNLSGKTSASFSFQYHMLGPSVGTLSLQASTNGTSWTTIWTLSGDQGSSWLSANVNLSAYLGQSELRLRFNGLTASSWQGDICVDNIGLIATGATPAPVANFTANNTTITAGQSVTFTDQSTNSPTAWSWSFPGGSPSSSSSQNPTVTYNTAGSYNVSLTASNAGGSDGETKTAYITVNPAGSSGCTGGIASFPYNESFESNFGAWAQGSGDDFNWARRSGSTPSASTGPSGAAQGTYYVYVEASSPNYPNKTTILNSPCFDLSAATSANFSFQYHMYGATSMGSLQLQGRASGGSWATLWSRTGNQGNSWFTANVDLNAYTGSTLELRFVGSTSNTWQGDIAVDNVGLTAGSSTGCTDVTLTIVLDNYPEETSWQITDSGGTIVASGGTYGSQPDGSTITFTDCLQAGCYNFTISDAYGDGICCAYGNGSYLLQDGGGATLASGGSFGFSQTTNFCVSGGNRTGSSSMVVQSVTSEPRRSALQCFPNPARDALTVQLESKEDRIVDCRVTSLLGQTIQSFRWAVAEGKNQQQLDLSQLQPGAYLLQVSGEQQGLRFVVVR
ncbi:MAG: PKD domain-containing protein [Lewinellaceae bacterium]|nr:PKD domain-containing protein [Lewinellaceae bacterium]